MMNLREMITLLMVYGITSENIYDIVLSESFQHVALEFKKTIISHLAYFKSFSAILNLH